jgi:hypothetical protein
VAWDVPQAISTAQQLAARPRQSLLDTPPEEPFDRLTRLAAAVLDQVGRVRLRWLS